MRYLICALLTTFIIWAPTPGNTTNTAPDVVITNFHDTLLKILGEKSGQSDQERYDALQPTMDAAFNYQTMIKTVAGRQWRQADQKTQDMLQQAFRDVSIATYADQYAGLTDGKFETVGHRDGPRGLHLVDTKLVTSSREVSLTYVLRDQDNQWQIIDVLLDGGKISELARKASEYSKTLKDDGADALITVLKAQKRALLEN